MFGHFTTLCMKELKKFFTNSQNQVDLVRILIKDCSTNTCHIHAIRSREIWVTVEGQALLIKLHNGVPGKERTAALQSNQEGEDTKVFLCAQFAITLAISYYWQWYRHARFIPQLIPGNADCASAWKCFNHKLFRYFCNNSFVRFTTSLNRIYRMQFDKRFCKKGKTQVSEDSRIWREISWCVFLTWKTAGC